MRLQAERAGGAAARAARRLLLAGLVLGQAGCASLPDTINPVSWWHDLQGGAIAEQRPPPPGATDPDPNLGTVPARPAPTDAATRTAIADALVSDRSNAQHAAEAQPLPDPSLRTASPALFGKGTLPPPPPAGSPSASLDAVTAPPPPPAPHASPAGAPFAQAPRAAGPAPAPSRAPTTAVAAVPLTPPAADAPPASAAGPGAALPPVPQSPPAPPQLAGVPSSTAPTPPTATPLAPAVTGDAARSVSVAFPQGSATLSPVALAPLKQLATHRGQATIQVTGYGEAPSVDPEAQSRALTLGLARAQAIAAALAADGVPAASVQVAAEAAGRGALAHLVN